MIVSWRHPRNGRTLLHYASEKGRSKMATFLLGIGVNPRVLDASGHNCMHLASANGHTGIVEILVRIGIDPRVMEEGGAGNVMTLFKHANVMSDLRKVPITNFKLKRPDPGGGKLK
jgi:ankyrin repeat protein